MAAYNGSIRSRRRSVEPGFSRVMSLRVLREAGRKLLFLLESLAVLLFVT